MIRKIIFFGILIGLGALFITACEKDDICLEPTTPKLVIRFYDVNNPDIPKEITELQIVPEGLTDTLRFINQDSIALPLDVNKDNCRFRFINDSNPDDLLFEYQREEIFVSKTCGYKTYFKNLSVSLQPDSDNWIKQLEILDNYIKIDTSAHVKIYH